MKAKLLMILVILPLAPVAALASGEENLVRVDQALDLLHESRLLGLAEGDVCVTEHLQAPLGDLAPGGSTLAGSLLPAIRLPA